VARSRRGLVELSNGSKKNWPHEPARPHPHRPHPSPRRRATGERASYRFFEFFTAQIRNSNTRRAYARAAVEFFDWLASRGVTRLGGDEGRGAVGKRDKPGIHDVRRLPISAVHVGRPST
jgi:hypothetical protein